VVITIRPACAENAVGWIQNKDQPAFKQRIYQGATKRYNNKSVNSSAQPKFQFKDIAEASVCLFILNASYILYLEINYGSFSCALQLPPTV
jgi:hypothetical protein